MIELHPRLFVFALFAGLVATSATASSEEEAATLLLEARAEIDAAVPDGPLSTWSDRRLRRAERALERAHELGGLQIADIEAHQALVAVLREGRRSDPDPDVYADGLATAWERYESGEPGPGLEVALLLLCGPRPCTPFERWKNPSPLEGPPAPDVPEGSTSEIVAPKKIHSPHPGYNEYARAARVRGTMDLQAVIGTAGDVVSVKVVRGLPFGLTERAVSALADTRFEPATFRGDPVEVHYALRINFGLE